MPKLPCPIPGYDETGDDDAPRYYVVVPDEWLGLHSETYQNVKQSLENAGRALPPMYHNLTISLALADDYRLPMLEGKPDRWPDDVFPNFPLRVMAWVNFVLLESYLNCFTVKKNWLTPFVNG